MVDQFTNVKSKKWSSEDGGDLNDLLIGGLWDNELIAGDGDDFLYGNGTGIVSHDSVDKDTLEGGNGYDQYFVDKHDTIKDEDGKRNVTYYKTKLGLATRKKGEIEYKDSYNNTFIYDEPSNGNKGHLTVNTG